MSAARVSAVAAHTFREALRQRVLYNLVFFSILMTVSGLVLGQLSIRQDEKIITDLGLAAMEFFGTLIAFFLGVSLVSREIERRSLYPLLATPLQRGEFLLGKFLGLSFTVFVNLAVMTLGLYATLLATGRQADPQLLKAIYGILLGLVLLVGVALLFSTVTSPTLAAVCTLCLLVGGRFSDVIRNLHQVAPGAPAPLIKALYYALPNYRNFDFKDAVVYGDPVTMVQLGWTSLYAVLYLAVVLTLAGLSFRSKDLQ